MFRRFSANFAVLTIFIDLVLVDLALWISVVIRPALNYPPFIQRIEGPISVPGFLYVIFPVLWIGVLFQFSVYDGRRNLKMVDELTSLTLGSALASVALAGLLYLSFRNISRFLFLFFVFLSYLSLLNWRFVLRAIFRSKWMQEVKSRRLLILGAGEVGRRLQEEMQSQSGPFQGLKLVGFLDDDPAKRAVWADILGSLDQVRKVVQQNQIDDVVVALPLSAHKRVNQMVTELHDLPVRVWVIPDYFSLTMHRATIEEFAGIPMLDLRAPALSEYQRMVKRAFDIIVTLILMPVVIPLGGIVSLAIWLDSPGPIFYKSRRVGENGRLFDMLKFRTMVVNADQLRPQVEELDEQAHIIHKIRSDPRVTRIGRLLRRTSIDEFPQLINVLKGEMSLVGPRPEMPWLVEKYDPWQRKRFALPQGMTGWWQVNGRSDRPMHLNTEDDLYYVQHYSLLLDLYILVKTVWVVLRGEGAF